MITLLDISIAHSRNTKGDSSQRAHFSLGMEAFDPKCEQCESYVPLLAQMHSALDKNCQILSYH